MNLQDFACACSDLIWGGELGWDRAEGLNKLFEVIKGKVKQPINKGNTYDGYLRGYADCKREHEEQIKQLKEVARQKTELIESLEQNTWQKNNKKIHQTSR